MNQPRALIVDDEPHIRELLEITLARMEVATTAVESLQSAYAAAEAQDFDLCITDMCLPDGDGVNLVRHLAQNYPQLPIAMITAHGSMESAVAALKAGAFDFVSKPVDLDVLRKLVNTALKLSSREVAPSRLLIGESPPMRETRAKIAKLARSQAPVYVSGESGTGKELVARMIHEQGPRAAGPFVPVNCGAIAQELMESEFFGHRKGSFTGAVAEKLGLFQAADGGTLFLDEVGDLPIAMQVKLLRAIQERSVRPVGAEREVQVDARILSASHKDLGHLVKDGQFREDLYYRLDVIRLCVPALRERADDIPLIAAHILQKLAHACATSPPVLSAEALDRLRGYHFPGNVRELENILERAMTLCEGQEISRDDLGLPGEVARGGVQELEQETGVAVTSDLEAVLENVEKQKILDALKRVRWNKTAAAKLLGISFGALRYRMQKFELD